MNLSILGFTMPGGMEIAILIAVVVIGLTFLFFLFRFLWRVGSKASRNSVEI